MSGIRWLAVGDRSKTTVFPMSCRLATDLHKTSYRGTLCRAATRAPTSARSNLLSGARSNLLSGSCLRKRNSRWRSVCVCWENTNSQKKKTRKRKGEEKYHLVMSMVMQNWNSSNSYHEEEESGSQSVQKR